VSLPEPVRAFCYAANELVPGTRRTPWGLVTTDPRFPMIWDANNAAVLEPSPGLRLEDIEDVLVPALRAAGAGHHHVEVWETSVANPALRTMRRRGGRTRPDVVMVFEGTSTPPAGDVEVRELDEPDEDFWPWFRASLNEFGTEQTDEVLDQQVGRTRAVFVPAGMRWFVGFVEGERAGYTSLLSVGGVGYMDNVVTMPPFRRRGVGSATVSRAIAASRQSGDRALFLLTEEDNPARRLYERLGFRVRATVESFTRPLSQEAAPR
jgi:ribosomal protein S18 acetylase RimI-like enzyme